MPLLGIVAFARVLSFWFVSDDFVLLTLHSSRSALGPFLNWTPGFYRPLSSLLTWQLGFSLFGTNALPYHVVSLALHALIAWMLGRTVAEVSSEARLGWLAGAIFAVYPLSTEPVAWLSAQWDQLSAVCVLGAIWAFAHAWKTGNRAVYLAGFVSSVLALLMKESATPLALVLPAVAITARLSPPVDGEIISPTNARAWISLVRRAVAWSLPYFVPTIVYGLALVLGAFKGYPQTRGDYQHYLWDWLTAAQLRVLMPLNASVFPRTVLQVTGLLMTMGILIGLMLWGKRRWPMLTLAAWWFVVFLIPVINMQSFDPEVLNNRVYYIAFMGFCIGLASILSGLLDSPARRRVAWPLIAVALLLVIPVTWLQLQPWAQSSRLTENIVTELAQTLPSVPGRTIRLHVKDLPTMYKGSYVFFMGLDSAVGTFNHQRAQVTVEEQPRFDPHELAQPPAGTGGIFQVGFTVDPKDELFHVNKLAGITAAIPPPGGDQAWDYSACHQGQTFAWQAHDATFGCAPKPVSPPTKASTYANFEPGSADGKLVLTGIDLDLSGAQWLRLAVCARLSASQSEHMGEWFWLADGQGGWSQENSHAFPLNQTGVWRTYWTFLPAREIGQHLDALRFDPVNDKSAVDVQWIALRVIK